METKRPERCFYALPDGEIVLIHYGSKGYFQTGQKRETEEAKRLAENLNKVMNVSRAEANAMICLSMQGELGKTEYNRRYDELVRVYNAK